MKEKLKSILAQLEFRYNLMQWEEKGVNFSQHLYVPEIHPYSGDVFVKERMKRMC